MIGEKAADMIRADARRLTALMSTTARVALHTIQNHGDN